MKSKIHENKQKAILNRTKKCLLILLILPLISCAKSTKEIPDLAYGNNTEATVQTIINHAKWNALLQKHVSNKGSVDYKGFQKDAVELESYLDQLGKNVPTKSWPKNAVFAYWINAYNAFTVKLILDNYPLISIKDINNPWSKKFITLGAKKYSLEEIEHEILRKMNEPRIHFAINCASFSCPNLSNEAYKSATLDKQLTDAARNFMADNTKNTITKDKLVISKIFDWFSGDFKKKGSIIDFISQYSTVKIHPKAKISFKEYNWTLNE
ncbi:DUF547 domain-containing protein [Flavobacterium sp. RSP15]|uniref:DUF547 domain-containing protein n=1 Tax=Flavobacterium sp. RSP15 TaxID=2497485 RepID=UPI000F8345DF|nr:DUF547 domain-containing protein [Flavobacterium sp. RSP15]RTY88636.1 DUF547 domain-containing protein [Flavobacterium sp. RSP15]